MLSTNAQRFYELLIEIVKKEKKTFLLYSEIPYYIASDKCIEELIRESLIFKYSTAIGVRLHPVLPIKSERTCEIVQEVVRESGLL